jgi:glycosyltransferase involved in cell wall biosynthesis
MLAGVPVIASDIEPILEISRNGEFAEIFPVRDAGQLAERIIGLANDRERRSSLAARARTHAQEHFSITAHLSSLSKLYDSLLTN